MKTRKKRRSLLRFTLVELLVVVSIMILLISILLPAISKAKETAKGIGCFNNLKQLGLVMLSYVDDNNATFPDRGTTDAYTCWDWKLTDYLNFTRAKGPAIYHCPSGKVNYPTIKLCESRGYAMNLAVAEGTASVEDTKLSRSPRDNEILVLLDFWVQDTNLEAFVGGSRNNQEYILAGTHANRIAYRHNGKFNYWRKDGAVKTTPLGNGYGTLPIWHYYNNSSYAASAQHKYYQNGSVVE